MQSCFKADNDLFYVLDVIGTVRYSRSNLRTSESIDLCVQLAFIASHTVQTEVTLFTAGFTSFTMSYSREMCSFKVLSNLDGALL